jgi:small-conductance mechanosensitive channel
MGVDRLDVVAGAILAQSDVVDQVEGAVQSSQVTGWQVLAAIGVLILAFPVGRIVQRIVRRGFRKVPDVPAILIADIGRFAKWSVYLVAVAVALGLVGVDIGWIALIVVATLVVSLLALRPTIENMAAGLVLTIRPAFTLGDQIEVLGQRGTVTEIGTHSTVLKSVDGIESHLPNNTIIGQTINVYTAFDARRSDFNVSIASGTDLASALEAITKGVASAKGVVSDPAPETLASDFDQDALIVTVRFWYSSSETSDSSVKAAVIESVDQALKEAGIVPGGPTTGIDISSDGDTPTPSSQASKQADPG